MVWCVYIERDALEQLISLGEQIAEAQRARGALDLARITQRSKELQAELKKISFALQSPGHIHRLSQEGAGAGAGTSGSEQEETE
jgi:hypothetical protein